MHAKISQGTITKLGQRPKWFQNDGTPATDAQLAAGGWLPVVDEPPAFDTATQRRPQNPREDWLIHSDRVEITYTVTDKTLTEVKAERRREFNRKRSEGTYVGRIRWSAPDGTEIPLDLRSQEDRFNLTNLQGAAMLMQGQGISEPAIEFRDADNVTHALTPETTIALTQFALTYGMAWFRASWVHKDAIEAMTSVAEVVGYDDTTENGGWPQPVSI